MEFGFEYTSLLIGLCGFLALVAVVRHYAPRTPLPAESWLLLCGIGYGLLSPHSDALPAVVMVPELILGLILPVLVFAAGRRMPVGLLLRSSAPVALLVLLGVPVSIVVIGLPMAWALDIPYMHGLLLGAAVAATDPNSSSRILDEFPIPERLRLVIYGESVFNDSITVVLFTALAAVLVAGGEFSPFGIGIEAARGMLLAVPIGLLMGWMMGRLVKHWGEQNRVPGITLTLALAVATFLLSERLLHVSGIIAVLSAAFAFSHSRQSRAHGGREFYDELWNYVGSLASSVLFFALGAAVAAQGLVLGWALAMIPLALLVSRAILVYGSGPLLRLHGHAVPRDWRHVLMIGGVRGAVPAALVLMLPSDYVHRDALLTVVFTLILYSILVHPMWLRGHLARHRVSEPAGDEGTWPAVDQEGTGELPGVLARVLQGVEWAPAAIAGAAAGVVFGILEMTMVPLFLDQSPWAPVRMIAAIGLGPEVLPPQAALSTNVVVVALIVHFTLSLVYGWALAPIIKAAALTQAVLLGLAFGLAVYLVNFHLFTAMFPWFSEARNWVSILVHLVFGGALAGSYVGLRERARDPARSSSA